MKILFITLESRNNTTAANSTESECSEVAGPGSNDIAYTRQQRLLPIQMLSIAADLMDAGHSVHWPEESLSQKNLDRITALAQQFNPDVLFFACGDSQSSVLMASIAVKTGCVLGNQYMNTDLMRPARYWCGKLTDRQMSAELLLQMLDKSAGACASRSL